MITFLADYFSNELTGGSELSLDAIIEKCPYSWVKGGVLKFRVPYGDYCYKIKKIVPDKVYGVSPYWQSIEIDGGEDKSGYCHYLKIADTIFLSDQCKLCGVNIPKDGDYA